MLLEGQPIVNDIYASLTKDIKALAKCCITPHLAVILVGEYPESEIYVKLKEKQAREEGMEFSLYRFDKDDSQDKVLETIAYLNMDPDIHGIIIQLPLPEGFDTDKIINTVVSEKDVDGLKKDSPFTPPAPDAILRLLEYYKVDIAGKKIVIVGRGRLVGKPLTKMLEEREINVEAVDESTENLINKIREADILISATGTVGIITEDMIKNDAVVIDAAQDVRFESAKKKTSAITPPKGGVGPITVALLLANTVLAAKQTT